MESGGCGRQPDLGKRMGRTPGCHSDPHTRAVPGTTVAREPTHASAEVQRPLVKDNRGRRDTSRDAYAQVNLSQREEEVLRYVLAYPGRDWTRAELAKAMGWRDGPMCGRVNSLVAKGRLIEGPARDCAVGRRGHAVRSA
jgi:hypothetical protein